MTDEDQSGHLHAALSDLMRWIDGESLRATVIGGVAAGLQSQPRLTEDIDALVIGVEADQLIRSGKHYGFAARVADAVEFSRQTRVLLMRHRSGVDVDMSLGSLRFENEVVERAQRVDAGGLQVTIASPEDLIIMKALARRPRDIADIGSILETQLELDVDRIRHWVREFSMVLEMPEIFEDLEALLRQRRR